MNDLISVITIGRKRTVTLRRCVDSVQRQLHAPVEHILVSDACPAFYNASQAQAALYPNVRVTMLDVPATSLTYLPARAARSRNAGVAVAQGSFIAFLDDDNTWDENHLLALIQKLKSNPALGGAYSYRKLWDVDNRPYTLPLHPWTDSASADERYAELAEMGVYIRGTNLMRDKVLTNFKGQEMGLYTVDTSAWLLKTEVARRFPFRSDFSGTEIEQKISEDADLCIALHSAGVQLAPSGEFSLNYYLGGFSTAAHQSWHMNEDEFIVGD